MKLSEWLINNLKEFEELDIITPTERDQRGSIVTVKPKTMTLTQRLATELSKCERPVIYNIRRGLLRFSIHLYNDLDDMEKLVECMENIIKR